MPEEIHVITAGSKEVYEVVVSEDRLYVTIRLKENPKHAVKLASSVLPTLAEVLQKIKV